MTPTKQRKASMEEREHWIKVPDWIYIGGKEVTLRYQNPEGEFMESTFYPSDYEDAIKANDKKWEEKIKGMKVITMIGPGRFGDGKPTQVPTSEFGKGYNKALRDLLKDSLLERKK